MIWSPQIGTQSDAITATWCDEIFFGGARGGGKSDFLLGDYLQDVAVYGSAWRGVLFRRTYPELQDLIVRAKEIYLPAGAEWIAGEKEFKWRNGATLRMRYLDSDDDATNYQGHQYTWIGFDELTNWASSYCYNLLKACLRSGKEVKDKRIRSAGNPGGVGHNWVKTYFVDPHPAGYQPIFDEATQTTRMYIPSKLRDNYLLLEADPNYANRLKGVGSPELVRMWLEGDWNVLQGSYFPEFCNDHILQPFKIPQHWLKFRAMDWGSARPSSVGWYAISDGDGDPQSCPLYLPAGAMIKYRELYTCSTPNEGLRWTAVELAEKILALETPTEKITYSIADPSIFQQDGGVSIAEQFAKTGVYFSRADNSRLAGAEELRTRLKGIDNKPMIYFFSTCTHTIRTLPSLQHDHRRPEDVDTRGEDHAYDETRYACMSRPWIKKAAPKPQEIQSYQTMTFNQLISLEKKHKANKGRARI